MSTTMNSRSITDYILKLEKENRELQSLCGEQAETIRTITFNEIGLKKEIRDFKKIRAVLGDIDSHEVSRFKIEELKKLYQQSEKERVQALQELLSYRKKEKSSLYDTTSTRHMDFTNDNRGSFTQGKVARTRSRSHCYDCSQADSRSKWYHPLLMPFHEKYWII